MKIKQVETYNLTHKCTLQEQNKILKTSSVRRRPNRRIIFCDRIAETSVTINGIVHVIDCGLEFIRTYDQKKKTTNFQIQLISKSSAKQRKGRAGRTKAGECWRFYTEAQYESFKPQPIPEVHCLDIIPLCLRLIELETNPLNFKFLDFPSRSNIVSTLSDLLLLDCVVGNGSSYSLTEAGKLLLMHNSLDPKQVKMILHGKKLNQLPLFLMATAIMNNRTSLFKSSNRNISSEDQKDGDIVNVLRKVQEFKRKSVAEQNYWCGQENLEPKALKNIDQSYNRYCEDFKIPNNDSDFNKHDLTSRDKVELINKGICSGYFINVSHYNGHPHTGYCIIKNGIHAFINAKFSLVNPTEHEWIVFHTLNSTAKNMYSLRHIIPIKYEWIREFSQESFIKEVEEKLHEHTMEQLNVRLPKGVLEKILGFNTDVPKKKNARNNSVAGVQPNQTVSIKRLQDHLITELNKKLEQLQLLLYYNTELKKVELWCPSSKKTIVNLQFSEYIETLKRQLAEATIEIPIADGTRALVSCGGNIKKILLPGEYTRIFISNVPPEFEWTKQKFAQILQVLISDIDYVECFGMTYRSSWGIIVFNEPEKAKNLLERFQNNDLKNREENKDNADDNDDDENSLEGNNKIIGYVNINKNVCKLRQYTPGLIGSNVSKHTKLVITWYLCDNTGEGFMDFANSGCPLLIMDHYYNKLFTNNWKLKLGDFLDEKSGTIMKECRITISNLDSKLKDEDLIDWIKSQNDQDWYKNLIRAQVILNEDFSIECETSIATAWAKFGSLNMSTMEAYPERDGKLIATAVFPTEQDAVTIFEKYNRKESDIGCGKLYIRYDMAAEITVKYKIYKILENQINSLRYNIDNDTTYANYQISIFDNLDKNPNHDLDENEIGDNNDNNNDNNIDDNNDNNDKKENVNENDGNFNKIIRIEGSKPAIIRAIKRKFDQILSPIAFEGNIENKEEEKKVDEKLLENISYLIHEENGQILKEIESECKDIIIDTSKSKNYIHLYGNKEQCRNAISMMNEILNTSLKFFSYRISMDKGKLLTRLQLNAIERKTNCIIFLFPPDRKDKKIEIKIRCKNQEDFYSIQKSIGKIIGNKIDNNNNTDDNLCYGCYSPLTENETRYQLQCGHILCNECKTNLFLSLQLPFKCPHPDCRKMIVVRDLEDSLTPNDLRYVIMRCYNNFISSNNEYKNCLTPDCPQVYKPLIMKGFYRCPSCYEEFCLDCQVQYHHGLDCADYKKVGDNKQLDEYIKDNINNGFMRRCGNPDCRRPSFKDEGCNKVFCTFCQKYFCWICAKESDNNNNGFSSAIANDVYAHLTKQHGGFW